MLEKIFSLIIPKRVFKTLFGPNAPSCETSCQFSNHKCVFGGHNYNFQSDHRTVDWTDRDLVRIILTQNWRDTLSPDFLGRTKRKKKYYYRIIRDHWLNSLSQHFHCKPLVNVVTAFQNQKPKNNHQGAPAFWWFCFLIFKKKIASFKFLFIFRRLPCTSPYRDIYKTTHINYTIIPLYL